MLRWLAALAILSAPVAVAAEGLNVGGSFNDTVAFDSRSGYTPGDIESELRAGAYYGSPYAAEGKLRADFGTLGVSTFAAISSNGSNRPLVRNTELVKAYSYEIFDVRNGGAAPGTPVTLTFTAKVHIEAFGRAGGSFAASYPCLTHTGLDCFATGIVSEPGSGGSDLFGGIALDFNDAFDPANCAQFVVNGCTGPQLTVGNNVFTIQRLAHVGDVLALRTRFEVIASQYHPFIANGFTGAAFFGLNTARTYVSVSSPGVIVTARSGHDYTASAVPEPASWVLLITGFGLAGAALRRRQRVVLG